MIIPTISLEKELWEKGYAFVAGVDEAGKGPWAGPVTAGAVVITDISQIVKSVRDSKLMTSLQREKTYEEILKKSVAYGIGIVEADEIDSIGIDWAVKKAMLLALTGAESQLSGKLSFVIVDGSKTKRLEEYPTMRILKGGLYHYSIAAGSILAKITRDRIMQDFSLVYPEYGFDRHVGYGTKLHQEALKRYGPCEIHRKSYSPIRALL